MKYKRRFKMKRLHVLTILVVFSLSETILADIPNRTLVFKGTIKASKSIFDVNDTNRLFSQTIKAYWAVQVSTDSSNRGTVLDSNAVLYDTRMKYYRIIPDCITIDPCDPCGVIMLNFSATDSDGQISFYAVGKGRILKFSNDSAVAPDYTPKTLKGTGTILAFDVFNPSDTVSGPITVTMTLDSAMTRAANPDLYYPDDIINNVVTQLTSKGHWSIWPAGSSKWTVDARCFLKGPPGEFDDISVKDPSIVYSGGLYHLFYTGRDSSNWRMGYVSSSSISDLNNATRTLMSSLNAGNYFCAPQVFWFESKSKWYLIYQSEEGACYSTNNDVGDPNGWTAKSAMGFGSDCVDFWCISDGTNVYCFYSPLDGTILRRRTSVADFPAGWSSASVVATNTFEAPCVYENKTDGKYYMLTEDMFRYYKLWTAGNPGGTWTLISENWASKDNLIYSAEHWTDVVSHGEIIRSGTNERMEIDNINRCEFLIQGIPAGNYGDYSNWPFDLGIIRNY
jgi:hypothetical protein